MCQYLIGCVSFQRTNQLAELEESLEVVRSKINRDLDYLDALATKLASIGQGLYYNLHIKVRVGNLLFFSKKTTDLTSRGHRISFKHK